MVKEEGKATTVATTAQMIRVEKHEKIPEANAEIALPISKIQSLPQGLDFQHRKGRATAGVRVEHDTIYFTAHCDSLQQLVERYEAVMSGKEERQKENQVKEEKVKDKRMVYGFLGMALGVIVAAALLARRKLVRS